MSEKAGLEDRFRLKKVTDLLSDGHCRAELAREISR